MLVSFLRAPIRSALLGCACLGASVLAFALVAREQPGLAAASIIRRTDIDRDGLTDLQEYVLGTLPTKRDTDGDGFSDLEERARGSDALNVESIPQFSDFDLGMCASQEDGFVSVVSLVYLREARFDAATLEMGFLYRGRLIRMTPTVRQYTRGLLKRGAQASDKVAVLEVGLPEDLVRQLGQVTMFSILRGVDAAAEPQVRSMTFRSFSDVVVLVEPAPTALMASGTLPGNMGTGVVYRPLVDPGAIPLSWSGGQMCFQRTSAVGMNGLSIVHEVDGAGCMPMDSYCSPDDCAANVGRAMRLPDPVALLGG